MDVTRAPSRWRAPATPYDAWFDAPWGRHAAAVEHRSLLDAAGSVDRKVLLDAGCGTGRFLHRLETEGASTIGIDRDPDALRIAAQRSTGTLLVGDVYVLPLADGLVDVAFAVTVCEFTADPALVIAELVRVTRAGGRVVIGSLNRRSPWGWWNRRQFDAPPWDEARFLTRGSLLELGRPHGSCDLRSALYAPRHLPMVERWSPALETAGRRFAPQLGAFQVLTIDLGHARTAPGAAGEER